MFIPNSKRPDGNYDVIHHKAPSDFSIEQYVENSTSPHTLKEQNSTFEYKVPKGYEHLLSKKSIAEKKEISGNHVEELETRLDKTGERSWEGIDRIMKAIAKEYNISPKKLHDDFKAKNNQIPDEWVKRNDVSVVEDARSRGERLANSITFSSGNCRYRQNRR